MRLFFRRKREGVNSIETVFQALDGLLIPHDTVKLSHEGASPLVLLKNILFARHNRERVNHITGDCHYIALGTGRNTVLTIHDVGSALTGNILKRLYVKLLWFWLPLAIVRKVTVISEATKADLVKIAPFAKNKIAVIGDPYNEKFAGMAKTVMSTKPIILHIGTKSNKNLERVFEALAGIECKLIIVGKMSREQEDLAKHYTIDYDNLYDISLEDIVDCYRRCDIVSFPSLFEGFGMPVIEAQAARRPVLAGDIPVLRDVAGDDGALFADPYDVEDIRRGFKTLIYDAECRQKLIKAGEKNIPRFHPSAIASQYNELYSQL